jgi:hypothetical protein
MIGSMGSTRFGIESLRWKIGWASSWLGASFDGISSEEVEDDASIWKKFCSRHLRIDEYLSS